MGRDKEKSERIAASRQRVEDALREYFSEVNDGAYLTDYVAGMTGIGATEKPTAVYWNISSDSPLHSLRGLGLGLTDYLDAVHRGAMQ